MFKKKETIIFVLIHIIYIFCIYWSKLYYTDLIKDTFFNLFFPLIFYMIGFLVYIVTYKNRATFIFYILLTCVGIILLLPNTLTSYILISLFPTILYYFCAHFLNLNFSKKTHVLGGILGVLSIIAILLFFYNLPATYYLAFILYLALLFIVIVSFGNIAKNITKYKSLLVLSILFAFLPFALSIVLRPLGIDSFLGTTETFYTFIILPLAVGYILIEENSIAIYYSKKELLILFGTLLLFVGGLSLVMVYVLHILAFDVAIILMLVFLIGYIYISIINHYSSTKLDNITENLYENRKIEFLHQQKFQDIKEHYIKYVLKDLSLICDKDDTFFALSEDNKIQVFIRNGHVDRKQIIYNFSEIKTLNKQYYQTKKSRYYILSFAVSENTLCLIGINAPKDLLNEQLAKLDKFVAESKTSLKDLFELANLKQSYKSLPGVQPQDYVIEKYQYEMSKIQQDESQYLHDVILQKMVAVKNYLEVLETSNIEFKEYMLDELSVMNESIIGHMYDLFPFTLKNLSLQECISELLSRIKQTEEYKLSNANIRFEIKSSLKLTKRFLFYPVYSFIKELVMNTLKYAEATEIVVEVGHIDNDLVIKVSDNGNRKNVQDIIEDKYNKKHGMLFINHEVKELRGNLFIEKNELAGSVVIIQLPVS